MSRTWQVQNDIQIFPNSCNDYSIALLRSAVVCGVDWQNRHIVKMIACSGFKSIQVSYQALIWLSLQLRGTKMQFDPM